MGGPAISQDMARRGLRPAAELAASRPHGNRLKYIAGCRCFACRRANSAYETERAIARKNGDWNGYVAADRARQHIASLSAAGVGRKQVADAASVAASIVVKVITGERTKIRARTERAILAVTVLAMADGALVDAAPTWKLWDELQGWGIPKSHIARELGYKTPVLQIKRTQIRLRTAYEVEQLHKRLARVPAAKTLRLLADLREEGYRHDRLMQMLADLASKVGAAAPNLTVRRGFISAVAADLVERLHTQLTEIPA